MKGTCAGVGGEVWKCVRNVFENNDKTPPRGACAGGGKCGHVSDEGGKAVPFAGWCICGKCVPGIGCEADLESARSNPHSAPLLLLSAMVQLLSSAQPGSEFSGSFSGVMDAQSAHRAVVAHGILMILAWLVFLPAGAPPPPSPFPGGS